MVCIVCIINDTNAKKMSPIYMELTASANGQHLNVVQSVVGAVVLRYHYTTTTAISPTFGKPIITKKWRMLDKLNLVTGIHVLGCSSSR